MPNTVRLYRRTSKDVTLLDYWGLTRPDWHDETRESWDEGADYLLPDGCEVAESNAGELLIYDRRGRACAIGNHRHGPQLYLSDGSRPVLRAIPPAPSC